LSGGKAAHTERLEQLRDGDLLRSAPETWATAVLGLIGIDANDKNRSKLLSVLDAAYHFDVSLWDLAKDKSYDFKDHDSDWLDSQQLYYLCDPAVVFVTKDSRIKKRSRKSAQTDRILLYSEFVGRLP
jgi:hypothetical protein